MRAVDGMPFLIWLVYGFGIGILGAEAWSICSEADLCGAGVLARVLRHHAGRLISRLQICGLTAGYGDCDARVDDNQCMTWFLAFWTESSLVVSQ